MITVFFYKSIMGPEFNNILIADNLYKIAKYVKSIAIWSTEETYVKILTDNRIKDRYTSLFNWND